MASKTLPSSNGYFNKKMIAILEGDTKKSDNKRPAKNTSSKKK